MRTTRPLVLPWMVAEYAVFRSHLARTWSPFHGPATGVSTWEYPEVFMTRKPGREVYRHWPDRVENHSADSPHSKNALSAVHYVGAEN